MLGQIFDTLLGVLLMFAILGIVNSVLVEAVPRMLKIAGMRHTRGALLKLAIGNMLGVLQTSTSGPAVRLRQALYAHPLIRSLGKSPTETPSYISPTTFSSALIDILDNEGNAIALMLLPRASLRPDLLKSLIKDLHDAAANASCRAVRNLSVRLDTDLNAATKDDGTVDAGKLARFSLEWPSATDLIIESMEGDAASGVPSGKDQLSALLQLIAELPGSWKGGGLKQLGDQLDAILPEPERAKFQANTDANNQTYNNDALLTKLTRYVNAIENWESLSCQTSRGIKNSLDGIKYLIDSLPPDLGTLRHALDSIYARLSPTVQAGADDLQKFYAGVENWYCEVTERAAGWYKRNARVWGMVCALALCVCANADVIFVVRALSSDASLRAQVAAAAINAANEYGHPPAASAPQGAAPDAATSGAHAAGAGDAPADGSKPGTPASTDHKSAGAALAALSGNAIVWPKCESLFNSVDRGDNMSAQSVSDLLDCNRQVAALGMKYLETSSLPIGWSTARHDLIFGAAYQRQIGERSSLMRMVDVLTSGAFWLWMTGIIISSLAVTLGGEYWFNLLDQVIRLTGSQPTHPDQNANKDQTAKP